MAGVIRDNDEIQAGILSKGRAEFKPQDLADFQESLRAATGSQSGREAIPESQITVVRGLQICHFFLDASRDTRGIQDSLPTDESTATESFFTIRATGDWQAKAKVWVTTDISGDYEFVMVRGTEDGEGGYTLEGNPARDVVPLEAGVRQMVVLFDSIFKSCERNQILALGLRGRPAIEGAVLSGEYGQLVATAIK